MEYNTCTFFGHRTVSQEIAPILRSAVINLIENHNVRLFYVGNHGGFDSMVHSVLKELLEKYPIMYYVVLAYIPAERDKYGLTDYFDTLVPEGIEKVPRQFAITYRNKWMIKQSDYIITYVTHIGSNSAKFKDLAQKQGKTVINLCE